MQLQQKYFALYKMGQLLLYLFFMAHYFACGFYYIGLNSNESNSWINLHMKGEHLLKGKYVNSLYFTFITMVTVGYGDITPQTINEKVWHQNTHPMQDAII